MWRNKPRPPRGREANYCTDKRRGATEGKNHELLNKGEEIKPAMGKFDLAVI